MPSKKLYMEKEGEGTALSLEATILGRDINVVLSGGIPHIGCTVISQPRLSLTGDDSASCTTSVINVTGHKDDVICRMVSERLCREFQCTVVCSGGFHIDAIMPEQISAVQRLAQDALEGLVERLQEIYPLEEL